MLNIIEPLFIKYYSTIKPTGYNLSEGGKNKITHSETKSKISNTLKLKEIKPPSRKGIKLSEETKAKMNIKKIGIPRSEETKQKIRKKLIGIPLSNERKLKISNTKRGIK